MLNVYKIMSQNIGQAVATNGEQVTKQPLIRSMRSVKKAILNLLSCWIKRTTDPVFVSCLQVSDFACIRAPWLKLQPS